MPKPAATLRSPWVAQLPIRAAWAVTTVALAAWGWASIGYHQPWTVIPTAALLTWWGWSRVVAVGHGTRHDAVGAILAVASAVGWLVAQWWWHAEYLIVVRDPGFLTLSGLWLVDHPHTDIPTLGAHLGAQESFMALADAPQAWNLQGDVIQPQGATMLPATIAVGGWVGGTTGVLGANLVIGAAGLVAVYALARLMMGPLAALAPLAVTGLSLSHISLSRSPYTEPLTMLLAVVGIVLVARSLERRSVLDLVAVAVVSGAAVGVRIDGAAFAAGALVGVCVAVLVLGPGRRWAVRALVTVTVVQASTVALGYLALHRWSQAYLERLEDNALLLMAGYGAVVVAALIAAVVAALPGATNRVQAILTHRQVALALAWTASAVLVVLASRPWWTTVHRGTEKENHVFANSVTGSFQRQAGVDVEPTRTYAEHTVTWMSYYLTWPLVLLGIAGVGWLVYVGLTRRPAAIALVATLAAPALLYLWTPSIIPDQVWAIRRLAPAAMVLIIMGACVALWALRDRALARWPDRRLTATGVVAVVAVLAPLSSWILVGGHPQQALAVSAPVTVREMDGARAQFEDLCEIIDGRPVVLAGTSSHFGGLRVICDVPVVLVLGEVSADELTDIVAPWESAVVVTRSEDWFTWTTAPEVVVESSVTQANYRLQGIPYDAIVRRYSWRVGEVNPDGTLTPVSIAQP